MALDRYHTAEFLVRVSVLLAEAKATKATIAQTDRLIARELVARRAEMLKELCGAAYVLREPDGISVYLGPAPTKH